MTNASEEDNAMGWAAGIVKAVVHNAYLGGEVKAAFLQGANELGAALKAFPDSIQIEEPGAAFNPLYRDRDGDTPAHPYGGGTEPPAVASPSEIAGQGQAQGTVHGESQLDPSPSRIADDSSAYSPSAQEGNVHGRDHGRGI